MVSRLVLVCLCIGLLPSIANAQTQGASAPLTRGDFEAIIMRLAGLEEKIDGLNTKIEQIQTDHGLQLAEMEERVKTLSDVQQGSQEAFDRIARTDKDGRQYLRIDASHEDTATELRNAIEKVAPERGTVILRNKTNSLQSVDINGTTVDILAKSERPVEVPYRPFTVRTVSNRTLHWDFSYPKKTAFVNITVITVPSTRYW